MTFLPKNYSVPKATEEDKVNFLLGQARKGKAYAQYILHNQYGLGDNLPWSELDSGEPPVEYSKL